MRGGRSLILNADDFGYSPEVNAAVLKAHREGPLTSASLMVTEPGFAEAVEIARRNPALGVGLHVVTTYDHALLPPSELPLLAGPDGKFGADPLRMGLRYAFSRPARRQLQQEMAAQFARFAQTGLPWSHADGHQHFHLHPAVWDIFLSLCLEYGVHRVRIPQEEILAHRRDGGDRALIQLFAALVFRALGRRARRAMRRAEGQGAPPFFVCDRVYGLLQTGQMDRRYSLRLLERLQGKVNEVYFHPGSPHAHPLPEAERADGVRDVELAALLTSELRVQIAARGLQLCTYAEAEMKQVRDSSQPQG